MNTKKKPSEAKRGRPPVDGESRSVQVQIRLTESELASWHEAASREGRPLSNWIRRTVVNSLK
jgi:hypothetical protein